MKRISIKIVFIGIVLCLIPVICSGQKNYTPGFIASLLKKVWKGLKEKLR